MAECIETSSQLPLNYVLTVLSLLDRGSETIFE